MAEQHSKTEVSFSRWLRHRNNDGEDKDNEGLAILKPWRRWKHKRKNVSKRDDIADIESPSPTEATQSPREPESDSPLHDFSRSLDSVKDRGWYWGPISGDAAEKLLATEPDGSFVVRDSSDQHYIFSLTFKLNGNIRHCRIEHDQGNFSFGTFTSFKSSTIVDFIENAVEHSRSGRFLFFLHRRPVLGPMRVQLLHPVSRFKHVQSLQHQCRFIILRHVPRDLLHKLPVPAKIQSYLNTPFYYSEAIADNNQ